MNLDHSPSNEEIHQFFKSINKKSSPQEIKTSARKVFTKQKVWIETKSINDDIQVLLLKIKQDLDIK